MNLNLFMYFISSMVLFFFGLMLMMVFMYLIYNNMVIFLEWEIFSLNSLDIIYIMLFDWMSVIFMSCVMLISSMVVYYSQSYMLMDKSKMRFLLLVLLFILSMMLMILSPNMISILLGWDGLGLVSFLLVIYYSNMKSYNSGMVTILSNRVGDVAILMCIAWLMNFGSWNLYMYMDYMYNMDYMYMIGVLIIIAGMTKSAQIPFSAWLPMAMAAPTPVSALVHSSTLVTAGVYMMIRFSKMMENSWMVKMLLLLGCLTMFMSGMSASYEYDLKKVIALSTLSQLGLMMSILSLGYVNLAFFHLLTHAFFKALLFLCAGVLIHSFKDMQDIRYMSIGKWMPLIFSGFLISNLALCGMPFLSGFYSKDLILEMMSMSSMNLLIYFLFYFSTGLTVTYSLRLIYYSFLNNMNFFTLNNFHGEDYFMVKSIWGLMIMSMLSGSMFLWMIFSEIYYVYLPFNMKIMVLYVIFMGGGLGLYLFYMFNFSKNKIIYLKNYFINYMWFLSFLTSYSMNYQILYVGQYMVKILDFGWLEYFASMNIFKYLLYNISILQYMQMNLLKMFMLIFIFWIFIIFMMF
uniref:NADH-ubiquinone oxidoreductase chain 5 n=1 Tax=Beraea pullata TaxID=177796 RepID=A0A7G7CEL3_9NEOP|nr:NADH dehydrogenase subunit 5 [Beraea pullata]